MGTARVREKRWTSGSPGSAKWDTLEVVNKPLANYVKTEDWVGLPKTDNTFTLNRRVIERGSTVNGGFQHLGKPAIYRAHRPSCMITPMPYARLVGRFRPVTTAVSNAHPGNPDVSVPNFLFELKDVPGMLKHAGRMARRLSKNAGHPPITQIARYLDSPKANAEDWLAFNFGWVPFFSDLASISDLAASMEKRMRLHKKLAKNRYVSRRRDIGRNVEVEVDGRYPYDTWALNNIWATATTTYSSERWVVAKWLYMANFPYSTPTNADPMRALKEVLGLEVTFQTVWDAIPWSWLVDYFTDLSDMINARSNKAGLQLFSVCTMTHNRARRVITPRPSKAGVTAGPVVILSEQKLRTVGLPLLPSLNLSYLSARQLGNLAALKVASNRQLSYF